jgi:hypothetical protein
VPQFLYLAFFPLVTEFRYNYLASLFVCLMTFPSVHLSSSFSLGGVRLTSPLGTSATNGPIVPALDDR